MAGGEGVGGGRIIVTIPHGKTSNFLRYSIQRRQDTVREQLVWTKCHSIVAKFHWGALSRVRISDVVVNR